MLRQVWVENTTRYCVTVHSENPGPVPHPGYWVEIPAGGRALVWIINAN